MHTHPSKPTIQVGMYHAQLLKHTHFLYFLSCEKPVSARYQIVKKVCAPWGSLRSGLLLVHMYLWLLYTLLHIFATFHTLMQYVSYGFVIMKMESQRNFEQNNFGIGRKCFFIERVGNYSGIPFETLSIQLKKSFLVTIS